MRVSLLSLAGGGSTGILIGCFCQCEVLESSGVPSSAEDEVRLAACGLVCEWAQKVLSQSFDCVEDLARYLLNSQYISTKSMVALTLTTGTSTGMGRALSE